jgi:hypothetical protein
MKTIPTKLPLVVAVSCSCFAASLSNAATIPTGTTLTVSTVTLITSKDVVGRSFEAKLAQDVSMKGNVLLKAGTTVFGKIKTSRYNPRRNEPLTVELFSIEVNGHRIALKSSSVQPHGPPQTARQAHYGHTAGTTVVNPGTRMQFQLLQPVTL